MNQRWLSQTTQDLVDHGGGMIPCTCVVWEEVHDVAVHCSGAGLIAWRT